MKKDMILLSATGLALVCAVAVYAGTSRTFPLQPDQDLTLVEGGIHQYGYGNVTVQTVKKGADVTVRLWSGAHNYTYVVRSQSTFRGTFTTDKNGNGSFRFHLSDVPPSGTHINVWQTVAADPDWVYNTSNLLWYSGPW
jgi:hypothetical protein